MSDIVINSLRYRRWRRRVESNGNLIKKIDILSVVSRQPGTYYAAFLDCLLETPEGTEISRCITLRGESIVVIPVFRCADDKEIYTLMVEQRCICDGGMHTGFPAGNSDEDESDFTSMACSELREELGIEVDPKELVPLIDTGISISPSLTDDLVYLYYFSRKVSLEWLKAMDGRSTGCHREGEFLTIRLHKISDILMMPTISTLIAIPLLEKALSDYSWAHLEKAGN